MTDSNIWNKRLQNDDYYELTLPFKRQEDKYRSALTFGSDDAGDAMLKSENSLFQLLRTPENFRDSNISFDDIDEESNLRLKIEKLRAYKEAEVRKVLQDFWALEKNLLEKIPDEEERKVIEATRPDVLEEPGNWTHRDYGHSNLMSESEGWAEFKNTQENPTEEINRLKSQVRLLRSRQSIAQKSPPGSLAHSQALQLAKATDEVNEDTLERIAEVCQQNWDSDLHARELAVKMEMDERFDEVRQHIRQDYEKLMNSELSVIEGQIQNSWQQRIDELKKSREQDEEFGDTLEVDRDKLRREVELTLIPVYQDKFRLQYAELRLKYQDADSPRGKLRSIYTQISRDLDKAYNARLDQERQAWRSELASQILPRLRDHANREAESILEEIEEEFRLQAQSDLENAVQQVKQESSQVSQQKIAEVKRFRDEHFDSIRRVARQQFIYSLRDEQIKENLTPGIRQKVYEHIRYKQSEGIISDLRKELTEAITEEVRNELSNSHEKVFKQLKARANEQIKQAKARLEQDHSKSIQAQVEEMVRRRTVELKQSYKNRLQKEVQDFYQEQVDKANSEVQETVEGISDQISEYQNQKLSLSLQLKQVKQENREQRKQLQLQKEDIRKRLQEVGGEGQWGDSLSYKSMGKSPKQTSKANPRSVQTADNYHQRIYTPLSQQSTIFKTDYILDTKSKNQLSPEEPKGILKPEIHSPSFYHSPEPNLLQSYTRESQEDRPYLQANSSENTASRLIAKNIESARQLYETSGMHSPSYYNRLPEAPLTFR